MFPPGPGSVDTDLPEDEQRKQLEEQQQAWDDAEDPQDEDEVLVKEGDQGRPMRDTTTFNEEELKGLRAASILGVLGTFIWAFGDLLGGLPK